MEALLITNNQTCMKIFVHNTKYVVMYRKHNSGKKLQHKYMQKKMFWKYIRVKRFGNDLRNEVCRDKESESRINSGNFYCSSVKKLLYSVYNPNNKLVPSIFMGVKFGLPTKRSKKSEGIRDEYGAEKGIWIKDGESNSMMKKTVATSYVIFIAHSFL